MVKTIWGLCASFFSMQISVDELENSISVKISKEAVMSINSPESLFTSVNGKLETKVYIAGLPNRTDNLIKLVSTLLKKYILIWPGMREPVQTPHSQPESNYRAQINPRLDGCIRGWNLMNQGASGVKEVIQEKQSKHCFLSVERGSFFTGEGLAHFYIDYSE